jgi:hypothetical protein
MEIILSDEDVKQLIHNSYNGVKDIKFSAENLKVTLSVDSNFFMKKTKPQIQIKEKVVAPPKKIDPDVKQKEEAKKGVMASGGDRRNLMRF